MVIAFMAYVPLKGKDMKKEETKIKQKSIKISLTRPVYGFGDNGAFGDHKDKANSKKALLRLEKYLPKLENRNFSAPVRWPLLLWSDIGNDGNVWQAWIDRGISPVFTWINTAKRVSRFAPMLKFFQTRKVPLIILAQGWVQRAFRLPPIGTGCNHLPPALPADKTISNMEPNHDFACAAWMYENPKLAEHAANAEACCRQLKKEGIKPAALFIDFESGAYIRNSGDKKERVLRAAQEAAKCPRCLKKFGKTSLSTPESYSKVVEKARAYSMRTGFTEPVAKIFPDVPIGNYYAYPVRRIKKLGKYAGGPSKFAAYGWTGSGFKVAQPRCYFIPGWHGGGKDPKRVGWNIMSYCLTVISQCAKVLRDDEILVPWLGYIWRNSNAKKFARRGLAIAPDYIYRETAYHLFLRGAETIAIFNPYGPGDDFSDDYKDCAWYEAGPFMTNVASIQHAYKDILKYDAFLRKGKVLNLEVEGVIRKPETAYIWSGKGTDSKALIRTFTLGPEKKKSIKLFGKTFNIPFGNKGKFFWVYKDGKVQPITD